MGYVYYNPNPKGKSSFDCTVRAISAIYNLSWHEAYHELCWAGDVECNMPSTNDSIDLVMRNGGYTKKFCEGCQSIAQFADHHREGRYLLMTGGHVVAVIDGNYYDALNTGSEKPEYYYSRS